MGSLKAPLFKTNIMTIKEQVRLAEERMKLPEILNLVAFENNTTAKKYY